MKSREFFPQWFTLHDSANEGTEEGWLPDVESGSAFRDAGSGCNPRLTKDINKHGDRRDSDPPPSHSWLFFSNEYKRMNKKRRRNARLARSRTGNVSITFNITDGCERATVTKEVMPVNAPPDNRCESQVGDVLSETIKKEKETYEKVDSDIDDVGLVCHNLDDNHGKALKVVRHLKRFHHLKPHGKVPAQIDCLTFRQSVRQVFSPKLTELEELTIKTSAKIVKRACKFCATEMDAMVEEYKESRFQPVEVDQAQLDLFEKFFRLNVPEGWNLHKESPYVPNGHCTMSNRRCDGGSWNVEEFSRDCEVTAVLSSGKPRIVTKYSSYNSEELKPLHDALYRTLKRKGWLLVGNPTDELVKNLNGGDLMSFDYKSATDNIKQAYVERAIKVLKDKASGLGWTQSVCLDVVAELRFAGDDRVATRGQPMGSLMSFPLLCLINKTVVDMSLTTCLEEGKISFKEWTSHRCLINGDDLLLRSPIPDSANFAMIHERIGDTIGLVVNREKTMVSKDKGEINSTLFVNGELTKKTNLGALYMAGKTADVVRVAEEAASSDREFRQIVRHNAHILARQSIKFPSPVPLRRREILFGDAKIRKALRAAPVSVRPAPYNPLPVVEKPSGYDLTPQEECEAIKGHVSHLRKRDRSDWQKILSNDPAKGFRVTTQPDKNKISSFYRLKWEPQSEKVALPCYRMWLEKNKKEMVCEDAAVTFLQRQRDIEERARDPLKNVPGLSSLPQEGPMACQLVAWIRTAKKACVGNNPGGAAMPRRPPETWILSDHTDDG